MARFSACASWMSSRAPSGKMRSTPGLHQRQSLEPHTSSLSTKGHGDSPRGVTPPARTSSSAPLTTRRTCCSSVVMPSSPSSHVIPFSPHICVYMDEPVALMCAQLQAEDRVWRCRPSIARAAGSLPASTFERSLNPSARPRLA